MGTAVFVKGHIAAGIVSLKGHIAVGTVVFVREEY